MKNYLHVVGGFNLQFLCLAMLLRPISYYEDMYTYKTRVDDDNSHIKLMTISCNDNSVEADELVRRFVYIIMY